MKEGWRMVKLGEVCEKVRNIKWTETSSEHLYQYIDLTSVDREASFISDTQLINSENAPSRAKQPVIKGDILFATTRPTLKRVCVIPYNYDGAICSTGFCVLRPKSDILCNWIYYALKDDSFMKYIMPLQKGASYPAVTDGDVKNFKLPLPPLEEQHRIVSILDASFEKIDALKKNAEENLKNAKALFQQDLAQELKPKEGWVEKKLGEIGDIQTGTTPDTKDKTNFGNFIPFVKPADVNYDGLGGLNYNNEGLSELGVSQSRLIKRKSVLMVCIGATISKTGYNTCDVTCNQQINTLTPYKDDYKYCYYAMIAPSFKYEILKEGNSHQTTLPIINKKKWSNLIISLPPLEEQHRIVRTLDTLSENCRRLEEDAQQTIRECDALKQSILRQAFSGEL